MTTACGELKLSAGEFIAGLESCDYPEIINAWAKAEVTTSEAATLRQTVTNQARIIEGDTLERKHQSRDVIIVIAMETGESDGKGMECYTKSRGGKFQENGPSIWNDGKGFGFITSSSGGKRVFVHIQAFGNRNRRPEVNQTVTFALSTDKQGQPCAVKATLAGDRHTQKTQQTNCSRSIIVADFFLVLILALYMDALNGSISVAGYTSTFRLQEYVNRMKDKSRLKADILSTELRSAIRSDVNLIKLII